MNLTLLQTAQGVASVAGALGLLFVVESLLWLAYRELVKPLLAGTPTRQ